MGLNINPQAAITPGGLNQSLAGLAATLATLPAKRREQAIEQQHAMLQQQGLARQIAQNQAQQAHWDASLKEQHDANQSLELERRAKALHESNKTLGEWGKGLAGMFGYGGKEMTPKDQAEIDHLNAETAAIKAGKPAKPAKPVNDLAPPSLINSIDDAWKAQEAENKARVDGVRGAQYLPAPGAAQHFRDVKFGDAGYDPKTLRKTTPQADPAGSPAAVPAPTPAASPNAVPVPMPTGRAAPANQAAPAGGTTGAGVVPAPAGNLRASVTKKWGGKVPDAVENALKHAEAGNQEAVQALKSKYGE